MTSLHGRTSFGRPFVSISALNRPEKTSACVNIGWLSTKTMSTEFLLEKWADYTRTKTRDRKYFPKPSKWNITAVFPLFCRPYDAKNPYLSKILVNRELFKNSDRSCMHIEFDIEESKMRYDSGDHLAVYPINNTELVEKVCFSL